MGQRLSRFAFAGPVSVIPWCVFGFLKLISSIGLHTHGAPSLTPTQRVDSLDTERSPFSNPTSTGGIKPGGETRIQKGVFPSADLRIPGGTPERAVSPSPRRTRGYQRVFHPKPATSKPLFPCTRQRKAEWTHKAVGSARYRTGHTTASGTFACLFTECCFNFRSLYVLRYRSRAEIIRLWRNTPPAFNLH